MASLAFIMALMVATVSGLIGFVIIETVTGEIDCNEMMLPMKTQCEGATSMAWLVMSILPIAMFFSIFIIFGGFGGDRLEDSGNDDNNSGTESRKERQRRKQTELDQKLQLYDDKQTHSFLTKWFRKKPEVD